LPHENISKKFGGADMTREEVDGDLSIRALRIMREIDALELEMDLEVPRDLEDLRAHLDKLTQDIERLAEEERENRDPRP
jgi:hypothetical protein